MHRPPPPPAAHARRLNNLAELAEIGMAVARSIGMQAVAEPDRGDPALAFSRVSKAVRLTIALEAMLEAGEIPGIKARATPRPPADPDPHDPDHDPDHDPAPRAEPSNRPERFDAEYHERSEVEQIVHALARGATVEDIIADLCTELGRAMHESKLTTTAPDFALRLETLRQEAADVGRISEAPSAAQAAPHWRTAAPPPAPHQHPPPDRIDSG